MKQLTPFINEIFSDRIKMLGVTNPWTNATKYLVL